MKPYHAIGDALQALNEDSLCKPGHILISFHNNFHNRKSHQMPNCRFLSEMDSWIKNLSPMKSIKLWTKWSPIPIAHWLNKKDEEIRTVWKAEINVLLAGWIGYLYKQNSMIHFLPNRSERPPKMTPPTCIIILMNKNKTMVQLGRWNGHWIDRDPWDSQDQ